MSDASGKQFRLELSNLKIASVSEFKGKPLLDLRNYFTTKDGETKPTQKGISLTAEQWLALLEKKDEISEALGVGEDKKPATRAKRVLSDEYVHDSDLEDEEPAAPQTKKSKTEDS